MLTAENDALKNEHALRAYLAAGSWNRAEEATGIPESTLRRRAKKLPVERIEVIRKEARGEMVTQMTAVLFHALGRMPEEIDNANLRDLVGLLKVGIEKILLMEGEATSRTEHSELRSVVDEALGELQREKIG